jgi:hypothetical protein
MELIIGGLVGGALVYLAGSSIVKDTAKAVVKTGYAVADTVTSVSAEAYESMKDLMAESKAEVDAANAARAEIHDPF